MLNFLLSLMVGLIAGWAAGKFVQDRGFGVIGDTVIGLIGGLIGGLLFRLVGLEESNVIGSIVISFVGAVIFLSIAKGFKGQSRTNP